MGEIVEAFRLAFNDMAPPRTDGCGPHCGHWDDIQQLTRLRAAVDAYIDAEQALTRYAVLGTHKRNPDTIADLDADVDTAYHQLRQAVGR